MSARIVVSATLLSALLAVGGAWAAPTPAVVAGFGADFPYRAFDTRDGKGHALRFYITQPAINDDRPLILAIQGSGCASQFSLREGLVYEGWHAFLRQASTGYAQVVVVDKPGVELFDRPARPGSADGCAKAFMEQQGEDRWLGMLRAAVTGAIELRGASPRAIAVVGHSEGAFFGPRLAMADPRITHVAVLSANPTSHLHDFIDMARSGEGFIAERAGSQADHLQRVLKAWADVSSRPDSTTEMVFGHPHAYWKDKFSPFDWSALARSPARFFLAHGDADRSSSIRAFDAFAIELLVRKRDVTWIRVKGGDHSLGRPGEKQPEGLQRICRRVIAWLRGEPGSDEDQVWPQ